MASSGNTWQKKLIDKDRRNKARFRYGSIVPVMDRIGQQRRGRDVQWPDDTGRVLTPRIPKDDRLPLRLKDDMVAWCPRKHFLRLLHARKAG